MRVEIFPVVEPDLDVILEFIARHNPTRAFTFVEELRQEFRRIGDNPWIYRSRPDLGKDIRMAPFGNYLILFRIGVEAVEIRRIVHGARNLKNLSV
jgi:plasmid stabilization system protein ParE